jgi:hypothetical protein
MDQSIDLKLDGEWLEFYKEYQDVFSVHKDSGVIQLLYRLNQEDFPLLPDDLDYDDESEYYKNFTLSWISRFFNQIPFQEMEMTIILVSTTGGPTVKFKTVDEMVDHLVYNVKYYQNSI